MGARQREWARRKRDELRAKLGGECVLCKQRGRVSRPGGLEFDVILPDQPGEIHHRKEWTWRMSFYNMQFKRGNLQLLCSYHNSQKATKDAQWLQLLQSQSQQPF